MRGFGPLVVEAIHDAVRRRIVAAIVVVCLLSLLMIDSCTASCAGEILVDGDLRRVAGVEGGLGSLMLVVLGLWVIVLAGVLASDHLQETLEDGSAHVALARPIRRDTFAFARLIGSLSIALATAVVLLGTAAGLLAARSGLPAAPALGASAACALGAVVVAAFAMAASLALPRLATVLLVFVAVGTISLANGLARLADGGLGWLGAIDRWGPPLASAMAAPLVAWVPELGGGTDAVWLLLRLAVWAAFGLATLAWGFRRVEL